jgi:hypothetical protein
MASFETSRSLKSSDFLRVINVKNMIFCQLSTYYYKGFFIEENDLNWTNFKFSFSFPLLKIAIFLG